MLLIELCLTVLVVPLAFLAPRLADRLFTWIERRVSQFAVRRKVAVLTIFLLALAARVAVLPIEPVRQPGIHDEFSYLLMADTFAHGRVTNPTHPMWVHFETFHVNQQPTYCSIYYPAQGLFLAFGQVVFGHPFWGVWLSVGLMCAAFCWALQGWMPPAWAFLGGVFAIIRLGTFSYWASSYWGGAVAAIGGALVLGAFPRIKRRLRVMDALILGLGLTILGNSRPYESVFYSAPILVALALFIFRSKDRLTLTRGILLPLGIVLVVTLSAMGYYFWQCTGSPLRPPYTVNFRTYEIAPLFPWQGMEPTPAYRHFVMEKFYSGWPVQQYNEARHAPAAHLFVRLLKGGLFFAGPALFLPWVLLVCILPYGMSLRQLGYKTGLLLATCFLSIVGLSLPVYFEPHYAAPVCCAFYALELQALRRIRLWDRRGKQKGKSVVRYLIAVCLFLFVIRVFVGHPHLPAPPDFLQTWSGQRTGDLARAAILGSLARQSGQHLIITRYPQSHDPATEWVYNAADIDGSKVVWARDRGEAQNLELIRYFKDRKVWLLEPDLTPPKLSAYSIIHSSTTHDPTAKLDTVSRPSSSYAPEVR
jgi:hypothetical protein